MVIRVVHVTLDTTSSSQIGPVREWELLNYKRGQQAQKQNNNPAWPNFAFNMELRASGRVTDPN